MALRRHTTQSLAVAGALLIVAGLSLGGGVALAVPAPEAGGPSAAPPGAVQATSTSSDKPSKKDRKSKKSTSTTSDSSGSGNSTDSADSTGTTASTTPTATGSTATTATTRPTATTATTRSTATTATTATTGTTRPTATGAPTTTATTSANSGGTASNGSADSTSSGSGGTYDGKPISATEDDATTTTIDDGRGTTSPPGKKPSSRSGDGLPPGIYPVEPGPGARTANSPAPSSTPAPATPVMPNPPIVVTETQPAQQTTSTTSAAAAGGEVTDPGAEVRGANQVQEESPAPARQARQLGQTGDGTRRLILFGGVALLIGAVVVGFTGRDGPLLAAAASLPAGPTRRRSRPRRELFGWEEGVPLAPGKREVARSRLGISVENYSDDEPGV